MDYNTYLKLVDKEGKWVAVDTLKIDHKKLRAENERLREALEWIDITIRGLRPS